MEGMKVQESFSGLADSCASSGDGSPWSPASSQWSELAVAIFGSRYTARARQSAGHDPEIDATAPPFLTPYFAPNLAEHSCNAETPPLESEISASNTRPTLQPVDSAQLSFLAGLQSWHY